MSAQEIPQLPEDQQWEYALWTVNQSSGWFSPGKSNAQWVSSLEGTVNLDLSWAEIGQAGWELVSSTTMATTAAGNTKEIMLIFVFKQRRAVDEERKIAQLLAPQVLMQRADEYVQEQKPTMALKALNRVIWIAGGREELYLARGKVHESLGNLEQALDDFSKAGRQGWLARGKVHLSLGNLEQALDDFSKAGSQGWVESGKAHLLTGSREKALAAFNKAIELDGKCAEAWVCSSQIHMSMGNKDQAVFALNKAISANGRYTLAWLEAGNIRFRDGEYQKAIENYTKGMDSIPDDKLNNSKLFHELKYNRGRAYRQIGRTKEAVKDLQDYLQIANPDASRAKEVEGILMDLERRK